LVGVAKENGFCVFAIRVPHTTCTITTSITSERALADFVVKGRHTAGRPTNGCCCALRII
jgi:hypothetical protein